MLVSIRVRKGHAREENGRCRDAPSRERVRVRRAHNCLLGVDTQPALDPAIRVRGTAKRHLPEVVSRHLEEEDVDGATWMDTHETFDQRACLG